MSNKEFDHLTIMRTRVGPSQGDATERQMLDAIDDTGNFRTRKIIHPDGSETRMRTRGGMPDFITTEVPLEEETTCTMKLDNGVVDLISASFLGTAAGDSDDGVLHRTDFVQQHITAKPENQIDGTIHPPAALGKSPDDNLPAKSFAHVDYGTTSYDKKRKAVLCPSSIFTGKMRTYIQALYGRHDFADFLMLPEVPESMPCVYIDQTGVFGDEENPTGGAVRLDTNCGIYTDPATCKHYLISIAGAVTKVYRLRATVCAEKLRKKLTSTTTTLGEKARVEAYILSQSFPVTSEDEITTLVSPDLPRYSMGYGWHFSYDGTKCDMVVTEYFGYGENRSTHYRLTFSFDPISGYWTLSPSVVEGPTNWKNYRHQHVIAYPSWDYSGLVKFGANGAVQPYGDAPFYCFYTRDGFDDAGEGALSLTMNSTLKPCRYSAVASTTPTGATRTPEYMNPNNLYVFGSDAADYRRWNAYEQKNYTVSCGGASVQAKDASFSKLCDTHSSAVADWSWSGSGGFFTGTYEGPGDYSVPTGQGVPDNCTKGWTYTPYEGSVYVCRQVEGQSNGGPYEQVTGHVDRTNYLGDSMGPTASTWTDETFTSSENYSAAFVIVVPFDDAEALYMLGSQSHSSLESGHSRERTGGTFFYSHAVRPYFNGPWTIIAVDARLGYWGTGAFSPGAVAFTNRDASPAPQNTYLMVGNYGVQNSVIVPSAGAFFNVTYDTIPVVVFHKSSSLGKAAHSDDFAIHEGMSGVTLSGKPFTFVGWA